MTAARTEVDSQVALQRFTGLLTQASVRSDVVEAVRRYLDSWPAERIARIQRIDAGWAPFDVQQHPSPPLGSADLCKMREAVHGQCAALTSAGLAVEPDLLELDLCLTLACRRIEDIPPEPAPARSAGPGVPRHA
ncbi:MAG: hypothetical protein OEV81_09905 [Betaproteobacteria bacterium]|nr:hypothetical protein [Betaproteobacteria bacterium]